MQTGSARAWLAVLAACGSVGCTNAPPPSAPRVAEAKPDHHIEREQRALEHRRLRLEYQLLSELRKLRDSRQASTGAAEQAPSSEPASPADDDLMVFGGVRREVFLGCLCDEHHPDSVFNMLGEHGSHLSSTSMRNKFSPYGSNFEDTSACSASATHPPFIMASNGKTLGQLTQNPSLPRRITTRSVVDWLGRMCGE